MKKLIFAAALLLFALPAFSETVTITWPAPSPAVTGGCHVWYDKQPSPPLMGTGATQGSSPINIAPGTNTATISGLPNGQSYTFAVSCYDSATATYPILEAPLSNLVVIPVLPAAVTETIVTVTGN